MLVLNQSYEPISICSIKKALGLVFLTKAELVENKNGHRIRTVNQSFPFPSVIRLSSYIRVPFKRIELSRKNIIRRDGYRCQYCGVKTHELTIDHVIPKSRGGTDSWENLVSACKICNNKKGNRTPEEAGMPLIAKPRKPNHILFLKHFVDKIDDEWKPFMFMD